MSICVYAQRNHILRNFRQKKDPSEICANPNLRNRTHITEKPSYVYTFFTYTLKEITALPHWGITHTYIHNYTSLEWGASRTITDIVLPQALSIRRRGRSEFLDFSDV